MNVTHARNVLLMFETNEKIEKNQLEKEILCGILIKRKQKQ